jgi:ParB-like chromosome segregation protein Spo0J
MNWKFETRKLADIKPWDKNPRKITEKGLKDLTASITRFGLPEPIVLNTDGTIIGGHARFLALKKQGATEAFCAIPDKPLTEKQLTELNIRLNKNIAGEFDWDILANEFEVDDLIEWGFDEEELGIDDIEKPELKTVELIPYKKIHVLLSFAPNDFDKIADLLEKIKETVGVEYEQSAN